MGKTQFKDYTVTYLNKNFRFVYTPNRDLFFVLPQLLKRKRFLIGAGSIHNYIGFPNSFKVISTALNSKTDKVTLKFRYFGKIEIYIK